MLPPECTADDLRIDQRTSESTIETMMQVMIGPRRCK
jgi:hypothetical protein